MQRSLLSRPWAQQLDGTFVSHTSQLCLDDRRSDPTNMLLGYTMAISVPAEISAAATVIQFWNASINSAVWISVFLVLIILLNLCGVKLYGEVCH